MSDFDSNHPLFTELTPEQAAIVEGGFFKKLINQQKKLTNGLRPLFRPGFQGVSPIVGNTAQPLVHPLAGSLVP